MYYLGKWTPKLSGGGGVNVEVLGRMCTILGN